MSRKYHEHWTEQDAMIQVLAREHRVPYPIHPHLVRDERDPIRQDGEEEHRQALAWRRKLIAELERRPDWVAAYRAWVDLNRRIEALCEQKGLNFGLDLPPWDAPDAVPDGNTDPDLPLAVKMRKRLIAELEAEAAAAA